MLRTLLREILIYLVRHCTVPAEVLTAIRPNGIAEVRRGRRSGLTSFPSWLP